jgi:hypothetical protein
MSLKTQSLVHESKGKIVATMDTVSDTANKIPHILWRPFLNPKGIHIFLSILVARVMS